MNELDKTFDPQSIEPKWVARWADTPFDADPASNRPPFTIVIPPPNVTGNLHTGHALDNTIIDVLTRFKRMQGFEALYLPGTDHAGISTQIVVERQLRSEGKSRHDLGREQFLKRVWEWKETSGGQIIGQLQRIGVSAAWRRERFTMDDGLSRAVRRAFVHYYHKGLAYRGERIVNWDPVAQTVLSDLEVNREDRPGKMVTLAYELEGGGEMLLATVRPETIFADQAVAVHPDDERFAAFVGRRCRIPLTDRWIAIITDEAVERDFGVGALKITPAHDQTDFEVGQRHGLASPSVIDKNARLVSDLVPEEFRGLDRFEARERVMEALQAANAVREVKDYSVSLGISERTGEPIEPLLLEQWFVKVRPLADAVIAALDRDEIAFIPERWKKVNRDWLVNLRDWAIARQLWWGHQIPAWYAPDGSIIVPDEDNPDLDPTDDPRYAGLELRRDPDVFDTWFSSALWPFSTLGWPDKTPDLEKFYPTSVLVTGYDIIFKWVSNMEMAGLEFMGRAPFSAVVLHGLYLDEKGQKMSKSKGNGIDPLELADRFGADACRFAWAALATGGQDIRHDERRYEQGRNFANKLWNASRFALMNLEGDLNGGEPTLADRWIEARAAQAVRDVTGLLEAFDLAGAVRAAYSFTWDEFCDWYIEAAKPSLREDNPATRRTLKRVLECILGLLHPFMPFITSELYAALNPAAGQLAEQAWPLAQDFDAEGPAEQEFEDLRSAVLLTRSLRSELGLSPAQPVQVGVSGAASGPVRANPAIFKLLARAEVTDTLPGKVLTGIASGVEVRLGFQGEADLEAFVSKSKGRIAELSRQLAGAKGKLNNPGFVTRAPQEVVEEERRRVAEWTAQIVRLDEILKSLA